MDLFAGAGGLTRGLKAGGFRIIGAVESDDLAVETYQVNFPEVHLWHRDIRRVTASELMRVLRLRRGQLDLLAACPPCEGFSRIRTKNGRRRPRDPRNDLVLETLRFIKGLRPKMVLLENVPALAKNERLMLRRRSFGSFPLSRGTGEGGSIYQRPTNSDAIWRRTASRMFMDAWLGTLWHQP